MSKSYVNGKAPWQKWEKKYTKRIQKLTKELNQILRKAPTGSTIPDNTEALYDLLREWHGW